MLRVSAPWPRHSGARVPAVVAAALAPLGLLAWLPSGPLAAGWAERAGTPASVLAAAHSTSGSPATHSASSSASSSTAASSQRTGPSSFSASTVGRITQVRLASGLMRVDVALAMPGHALGHLDIRIEGPPAGGGGYR